VIYLIALSVRLIGLKFSFPLLTHHDERAIIDPLIEMSRNHTLDSGQYQRPNQVLYSLLFGYLNLVSKVLFHKNFGWSYEENPLFFYYQARLVVAAIGSLAPVLAWKIGKLFKGVDFSMPAAFLTCFYTPYIVHSHYITGDMLNTVFSLAIILLCLVYLQKKKRIWLILACITVALNALEKYPGILSYGIILFTVGIRSFSQENKDKRMDLPFFMREFLITLVIVFLSMLILAPHLFTKLDQIRDVLIIEARVTHLGADNLNWLGNMLFYAQEFVRSGGWIVALFAAAGAILSALSGEPSMILVFFGAGYWAALSKLGLHWERWSLPMMITPLMLAALSMARLWVTFKRDNLIRIFMTVFFVVFFSAYILNGLTSSILLTWQDTRVDALQFTIQNEITQENSVSEGYTPFLPRTVKTIFDFDYQSPGQTRYVILSSNMYGRYEAEPDRYIQENNFYQGLRSNIPLIAEFVASERPSNPIEQFTVLLDFLTNLVTKTKTANTTGPTIQIYRLP
jgi:hypothetical protein